MDTKISELHANILNTIASIKQDSPSAASTIRLVGASKSQSTDIIMEYIRAGMRFFGENRVQEAESKWPAIRQQFPDVTLQLIGPLQTNKVRDAVAIFDEIASLDRTSLAEALAKEMTKQQRHLPCLIQVNIGDEPQKAGISLQETDAFIHYCIEELTLPIVGLMCVPPADDYPAPYFALLAKIAKTHGLKRLSMGMSHDFQTAIRMGATEVRIGTALFGERS